MFPASVLFLISVFFCLLSSGSWLACFIYFCFCSSSELSFCCLMACSFRRRCCSSALSASSFSALGFGLSAAGVRSLCFCFCAVPWCPFSLLLFLLSRHRFIWLDYFVVSCFACCFFSCLRLHFLQFLFNAVWWAVPVVFSFCRFFCGFFSFFFHLFCCCSRPACGCLVLYWLGSRHPVLVSVFFGDGFLVLSSRRCFFPARHLSN